MIFETAKALVKGVLHLVFRIKVTGMENFPANGGVIVAVNHRSNWDPVIMAIVSRRKLRFLSKSELFKNKLVGNFLKSLGAFPIERGKGDIGAIKTSLQVLSNEEPLLIFPEGKRTTDDSGERAKTGAIMIANHAGVPVIPIYISGEYKWMRRITVNVGEVFEVPSKQEEKLTREQMQELANELLQNIRQLKV